MINLPDRCQRLISRAEWHTARLKGAGGESKGSRRYDKENLLWQFTVAIRSDPVGSSKGLGANENYYCDNPVVYDFEWLRVFPHMALPV